MSGDGLDAEILFNTPCVGFGLDDLIVLPGHSTCSVEEVDLSTRFSRNVRIASPFVSAPLATVTEGRMAIACALAGGIGIIHNTCDPETQAKEVAFVKQYGQGFIMNPQVMAPKDTVADLNKRGATTGCFSALICEGGRVGGKLLGVVSSRDIDHHVDNSTKLADVMTPKERMRVAYEPISLEQAQSKLRASKVGKLPILNEAGELFAVVTRSDLKKSNAHPFASKDANHQLLVAAAVSPLNVEGDRVRRLVEAGVDVIVMDSTQGDTVLQADLIKRIKREFPTIDVVAGNVVTPKQAKPLLDAGADALRVGMGCSSLHSPLDMCSVGRPQASALFHVSRFAREFYNVPVLADGGVMTSAQVTMALTLGASAVICGSLLAGAEETPGQLFFHAGMRVKAHAGVGQLAFEPIPGVPDIRRGLFALAPAISTRQAVVGCVVVDKGPVLNMLSCLKDAIRRDLCRIGVNTLPQLHDDLAKGFTRFQIRSPAAYSAFAHSGA